MKMKVTIKIDVTTWDDPGLFLDETLDIFAEEYPSVISLLMDVLSDDTPRGVLVQLERDGLVAERIWKQ